jgi:hypothetical protein
MEPISQFIPARKFPEDFQNPKAWNKGAWGSIKDLGKHFILRISG